jgi:hypothetical protein
MSFSRCWINAFFRCSKHLSRYRVGTACAVVAGDASKLLLFLRDAAKRQVQEPIAFALYLPCIEMCLGFGLYSASVGRRQMLIEHLCNLRDDDLLILDRGYPGNWFVAPLAQTRWHFCIRADDTGYVCVKAFKRSGRSEQIVTLAARNLRDCHDFGCCPESSTVRLIRVNLPKARHSLDDLLWVGRLFDGFFLESDHIRWWIVKIPLR